VLALLGDLELPVHLLEIGEHGKRAVRLLAALDAHRHLLQLGVVHPHAAAVGHDGLLVRCGGFPAELPRRLQRQRAAAGLAGVAVGIGQRLGEVAGERMQAAGKRVQPCAGRPGGGLGRAGQRQQEDGGSDGEAFHGNPVRMAMRAL